MIKVYESGANVVIDEDGESLAQIPTRDARYQVSGSMVYIIDSKGVFSTIPAELSNLVNGSDTPLTTEALVHAEFRPYFGK